MRIAVALVIVAACREPSLTPDASSADAQLTCATSFGDKLTDTFGRIDGTVLAVVPPNTQSCAQPHRTHVVVQVTMQGAAYRMVTNVEVMTAERDAPLAGPPWVEGWHDNVELDYATTLGLTAGDFALENATTKILDAVKPGERISVYATSSGGFNSDSAHLVHRNLPNEDGAIVLTPDTTPRYLLFRFPNRF